MRAHTRLVLVIVLATTLLLAVAGSAGAVSKNCWGVVTSQRAVAEGDVGEHSSSFGGEPRLGLGNVAEALGFDHVSDLGAFLATVDEVEATTCE